MESATAMTRIAVQEDNGGEFGDKVHEFGEVPFRMVIIDVRDHSHIPDRTLPVDAGAVLGTLSASSALPSSSSSAPSMSFDSLSTDSTVSPQKVLGTLQHRDQRASLQISLSDAASDSSSLASSFASEHS